MTLVWFVGIKFEPACVNKRGTAGINGPRAISVWNVFTKTVLMFRTRELHHRKLLPVLVVQVPAQPGWPVKQTRAVKCFAFIGCLCGVMCLRALCCQRDTFKWWIASGRWSPFASSDSGMFLYFLSSTRRVWGVWEPVPLSQAALQSHRGVDEGLTASSSPLRWHHFTPAREHLHASN